MISKFVIIGLLAPSLGISIAKHKEDRGPSNAWHSFISVVVWILLLYWNGVFDAV